MQSQPHLLIVEACSRTCSHCRSLKNIIDYSYCFLLLSSSANLVWHLPCRCYQLLYLSFYHIRCHTVCKCRTHSRGFEVPWHLASFSSSVASLRFNPGTCFLLWSYRQTIWLLWLCCLSSCLRFIFRQPCILCLFLISESFDIRWLPSPNQWSSSLR